MSNKKFRLRDLLIDRADLVDKGANQEAFIELYKRDGVPGPKKEALAELLARAKNGKSQGGPPVDKDKKRPAFLDGAPEGEMEEEEAPPKGKGAIPEAAPKGKPLSDEEKKKLMDKKMSKALEAITKGLIETDVFVETATGDDLRDMLPPETLSSIEEVLKSDEIAEPVGEAGMSEENAISKADLDELVEYVTALEAERDDLAKRLEDPVEETEISKALADLPEEIAKSIEAERVELAKAREDLAKAEIAKADREYIAKMEALPGIVDNPKGFGPVMRQIASLDADLAKSVEAVLANANNRIAKGDLFTEVGVVNSHPTGGAFEQATSIAKSMQEATPELTLEEARSRVWESNPELYDQYTSEREAAK